MTWLLFFILSLATARITWLITEDHLPVIAKPRQWIVDRKPDGNLAYLVNCWYCSSVYVAAGAAAFAVWVLDITIGLFPGDSGEVTYSHIPDWKAFLLLWPALSFAAVGIMGAIDWLTAAPDKD